MVYSLIYTDHKETWIQALADHIILIVTEHSTDHEQIQRPSEDTADALEHLWKDDDVQLVFSRRNEYQLDDAVQ